MKMNSAQIEQTLTQFEAEPIPSEHPLMPQLKRLFGDHTYFLDNHGLNIVEPVEAEEKDGRMGVVVNLAENATAQGDRLNPGAAPRAGRVARPTRWERTKPRG